VQDCCEMTTSELKTRVKPTTQAVSDKKVDVSRLTEKFWVTIVMVPKGHWIYYKTSVIVIQHGGLMSLPGCSCSVGAVQWDDLLPRGRLITSWPRVEIGAR